jgi:hypothetical protein
MVLISGGFGLLREQPFKRKFEDLSSELSGELSNFGYAKTDAPCTHQLGLDKDFLNFIRLSVGIRKMNEKDALRFKNHADQRILEFMKTLKTFHTRLQDGDSGVKFGNANPFNNKA